MCGIAGYTGPCDPHILELLQNALHHRGPDERGTLCTPQLGLSSNRLAIIDLSGGRQPIYNEDRSCAIVFNGEIYNYRELRHDLQARHQFRTRSDTEVILHLYEEVGTEVSRQLKGDFAFCIWDLRNQSCFLSRDPLGVKPLFFAITKSGNLIFASELAPLLQYPELGATLDLDSVAEYLGRLYISAPRSVIKGVHKLSPGQSLLWQAGSARLWNYWNIPQVEEGSSSSFEDFRERTLGLLRVAVRRRLIADVKVGAFLSGGLDSSLIVALASEVSPGLPTFSIGYSEADFNELPYARMVSLRYKTEHHEFVLKPEGAGLLEEVIDAMDEPIADSSAVPTFLIARETRTAVKVALSGIGGDELFFGYPRHLGAKLSGWIPTYFAAPISGISRLFSSAPSGRDVSGRIERFGAGLSLPAGARYWQWTSFCDRETLESILYLRSAERNKVEEEALKLFEESSGSYLDKILRLDLSRYLASDLLKFADNMTMAHSLELRVPFCDVDLVEEVARTPAAVRFPGYRLKAVLKDIARDFLPEEIVHRPKQGFMVPIGRWFRGELKSYIEKHLAADRLPPCFNPLGVTRLLQAHVSGRENHTHLLWAILTLARWLDRHPSVKIPES
jgi:asparagine synthase (glutamine-hydrolysing)